MNFTTRKPDSLSSWWQLGSRLKPTDSERPCDASPGPGVSEVVDRGGGELATRVWRGSYDFGYGGVGFADSFSRRM